MHAVTAFYVFSNRALIHSVSLNVLLTKLLEGFYVNSNSIGQCISLRHEA